ncbi:MAG: alpha/beta hydrolase, partial [Anaerolineales bacterium]
GPTGALLIHGFTGSPNEMRPLGRALAAEGLTTLGVRLAHHGTTSADMFRSHWRDWVNSALDGYSLLRDQCQVIFVMGLSMGGAIALWLSARYLVAGVAAMSTPSQPFCDRMPRRVHPAVPFSYVRPYVTKSGSAPPPPTTGAEHVAYPAYPTRAIPQLRALLLEAAASLPRVTVPALLAHSRDDQGVPAENMPYIFEHLGSAAKEMLWLEKSGHVITEGCEQQQLFERIIHFVRAAQPAQEKA